MDEVALIIPGTRLVPVETAQRALGISHGTIWSLIGRGELRTVRIGRRRLVPVEALDEFVAAREGAA